MLIYDQVQGRLTALFPTPMRRALLLAGALGMLALVSSCSLILDLEQCSSDADCPSAGVCSDGICKLPQTVEVINHITEDTTWKADTIYVLKDVITVASPRVLTIEPGTRILGERGSALVSLAGARIEAVGTRDNPIVFTSAQPVGRRRAGDWGGVALIGKARVNRDNFGLRINDEEQHPLVGGGDDTWNCGSIKYVRIEFGGGKVAGDNALNGLTLAGCGTKPLSTTCRRTWGTTTTSRSSAAPSTCVTSCSPAPATTPSTLTPAGTAAPSSWPSNRTR